MTTSRPRRLTAAERAEAYLTLAERLKDQILPGDRGKFEEVKQMAAAVAENGEGGRIITGHQLVSWCYSDLDVLRVRWQARRLDELGQGWLEAKMAAVGRVKANEAFVAAGLQAAIEAWIKMTPSRQKLDAGFALMDTLRAPFGRCQECIRRGRKHPNPLTVSKSGKIFPVCNSCYREKLKGLDDRPTAASTASTAAVPTAPNRTKGSHSDSGKRWKKLGKQKSSAKAVPDGKSRDKGTSRKGGGQKKK